MRKMIIRKRFNSTLKLPKESEVLSISTRDSENIPVMFISVPLDSKRGVEDKKFTSVTNNDEIPDKPSRYLGTLEVGGIDTHYYEIT